MKQANAEDIVYSLEVILYWRVKVSYYKIYTKKIADKCDIPTGFYFVFPLHKK